MHRVFVYGTLRQKQRNHARFLSGSRYVGPAYTMSRDFEMFENPYFPVVMEGIGENSGHIKGEVYEVSDETLQRIDALEGYFHSNYPRNLYEREVVPLWCHDGKHVKEMVAMMYIRRRAMEGLQSYTKRNAAGHLEWPVPLT